jgi:hypothetical protein
MNTARRTIESDACGFENLEVMIGPDENMEEIFRDRPSASKSRGDGAAVACH